MMNANSPHAAIAKPTVVALARVRGVAHTPVASLPRAARKKRPARPKTAADEKERTGTANPQLAAKKSFSSHVCSRLTCLVHAACSRGSVQQHRPARKAPSRCEAPSEWASGMNAQARPRRISSRYLSLSPPRAASNWRGAARAARASSCGMPQRDMAPATSIKPAEARTGVRSAKAERRAAMDWSSVRRSSAMTSSSTAAAMMSWPVGVFST
mmetsp:Transcript_28113/g.85888  ORF Transcript_28113/g.85888 Transcript_28113/m.85888 type:complete len:213 (-) Transcript_28113:274-912(-)